MTVRFCLILTHQKHVKIPICQQKLSNLIKKFLKYCFIFWIQQISIFPQTMKLANVLSVYHSEIITIDKLAYYLIRQKFLKDVTFFNDLLKTTIA